MNKYPFIFSEQLKYRAQRHFSFWTFWWLFQGFLYAFAPYPTTLTYAQRLPISLLDSLIYLPAHIFLSYTLMYFVIPRFLIRGKYLVSALWVILLILATSIFASSLGKYLITPVRDFIFPDNLRLPHPNMQQAFYLSLLAGLRGGLTIGGMAAAIKLMKYWYVKEQSNLALQKENAEAQLQLLKAQVHPHFLFNTLNNIYSYTQNTSSVASELITRLSDLLRFVLYETRQPLVPLAKELKMIEDYISLEKIRYGNKLELDLQLPAKTNDLYIAPLLILPLIENCFKHGTSHVLDQPWISLHIDIVADQMQMKLLNGKIHDTIETNQPAGIGIENVNKRLQLLYPGKHEFTITSEEEVFIVNLKVQLEQKHEPQLKTIESPLRAYAQ